MTKYELAAVDIIEIFEGFLEERDIRIPTSDAEMEENGDSPEENSARIYGMDFAELEDQIVGYLYGFNGNDDEEDEEEEY